MISAQRTYCFPIFAALVVLFLVAGCGEPQLLSLNTSSDVSLSAYTSQPLNYQAERSGPLLVRLDSNVTGIDFENSLSAPFVMDHYWNGAGLAAGDYDGDGLADVYLVSEQGPNRLYRSLGNMRFEDVTSAAGLEQPFNESGFSMGAHFADIDNDGHLDLFVTNWERPNQLYRNNGDGTFADITEAAGVGYTGGSTTATFDDYDRDGDLDFFVATYRSSDILRDAEIDLADHVQLDAAGNVIISDEMQDRLAAMPLMGHPDEPYVVQLGEPDLLYRNRGDGTFEQVAEAAGITGGYWGLSAKFVDLDQDQWPDLYITNDFWTPDQFYHNQGDGTFVLVEKAMVQHTPWFSMGFDAADINNDGLNDFFIGDMLSRTHEKRMTQHGGMEMVELPPDVAPQLMRNGLYLNNGDGSFSDIAWLAGVAASDWTWTAKFADLDLDSYVDLLITTGMSHDLMDADGQLRAMSLSPQLSSATIIAESMPPLQTRDLVFRNRGDLSFTDASEEWGFTSTQVGRGAALADYDGDGDLDAIVSYLNAPVGIFRNDATNPRIAVKLVGTQSNRYGLGATVILKTDVGVQTRTMSSSGGYLSGHEPVVVLGLGTSATIKELQIIWPSGQEQIFAGTQLLPDQLYTITEPATPVTQLSPALTGHQDRTTYFEEVGLRAGIDWQHSEDAFDDFSVQPLLPRRLSVLGPGVAWGDSDGDGWDDLYISGASGQSGVFFRNQGDGSFAQTGPINLTNEMDELAPLWWRNQQGEEASLLLSFSSVEAKQPAGARFEPRQESYEQQVWAEDLAESSGALAMADFDNDGDLDLFVGGRVQPGAWPLPTSSHLYANESGDFVDVTAKVAPDLLMLGLATGATWTDIDNDGDSDLVIATEWGPIHLLINEEGHLASHTASSGLSEWTGFWTGVVSGDFDQDGDIDLAAANLGLNTPYTASDTHPATLFAGDIDQNGDLDLVEAYYVGDTLYPMRYRGMVARDIPSIMEQFASYQEYAEMTLEEIYGSRLQNAQRFTANTLEHSIFLNDGAGGFVRKPLPSAAQSTAGFGLTIADFDNDGFDDLYLVGNFSHADMEIGAYHGSVSTWLRGGGDGTFVAVPVSTSGLSVPYDGRGVAVADYDQDGWVDIAVGVNDYRPLLFRNQGSIDPDSRNNHSISVSLHGLSPNPDGIGTRITVTKPDDSSTVREIQAGSGYLSQSSTTHLFGLGTATNATIHVRWPNGEITSHHAVAGERVVLKQ